MKQETWIYGHGLEFSLLFGRGLRLREWIWTPSNTKFLSSGNSHTKNQLELLKHLPTVHQVTDTQQGCSQKFVLGSINFYCTILQSYTLTSSAAISAQNNFQGLILGGYIYRYTTPVDTRPWALRFPWGAGSPSNTISHGPRLIHPYTKWHLDPSNCLATIHQCYRQTDRQTDRKTVPHIRRTVTCNGRPKNYTDYAKKHEFYEF